MPKVSRTKTGYKRHKALTVLGGRLRAVPLHAHPIRLTPTTRRMRPQPGQHLIPVELPCMPVPVGGYYMTPITAHQSEETIIVPLPYGTEVSSGTIYWERQ